MAETMTAAPRPPLSEAEIASLEQRLSWVDVSSHLTPAEVKYDVAQWKRALAELRALRAVADAAEARAWTDLHAARQRGGRQYEQSFCSTEAWALICVLRAAGRLATGTENSDE